MSSQDNLTEHPDAGSAQGSTMADDHGQDVNPGFTFFHKHRPASDATATLMPAYASPAEVSALVLRLDQAAAATTKIQRHITELMGLMTEIAQEFNAPAPAPRKSMSRRSKWFFYLCLACLAMGWFLLSPTGHAVLGRILGAV